VVITIFGLYLAFQNEGKRVDIIQKAREVIGIESEMIADLSKSIDQNFVAAAKSILNTKGRVVVSGMGKSGHIGSKIAATLASTGTPSFFMHPAEALHGDMGMLTPDDTLLAISYSGENEEILRMIPLLKHRGIGLIAMTGNSNTALGKEADHTISIHVRQEACPLQLAPTSSTTAALVMGDALAVVLMEIRGFHPEDFALFHPAGSLGRKLLTRVKDIMRSDALPTLDPHSDFAEVIRTMTSGKLGLAIVMDQNKVLGVITDGDLRRALEKTDKSRFSLTAEEMMTRAPKTISQEMMVTDAEALMVSQKIKELLVTDTSGALCGVIQLFDTGRAG